MNRDDDLFAEALALPAAERAALLDRACAGDAAQRARLEALLANAAETNGFLEIPVAPLLGASPLEEKPGDVIGRYRLLEKIGEGGCGVVFMAAQREPVRRQVALKVIKLGMDTKEVVARFEVERQALALMDHPNIARVFDGGATRNGRPYFVMELVRGRPITSYCDEQKLTTLQRIELFISVCHAVQHAHQKGIVHRDLKPSNILVTINDGAAVPKIIDFGIAKATQGPLTDATLFTAFHQFIGTPAYMSPEQADLSSVDIDTRSDIYSLGVLLYELLVGQPPFNPKTLGSEGLDEVRRIIREVEPARPSARLDTLAADTRRTVALARGSAAAQLSIILRGDLDWIVMRCLEKDRRRRYETASTLADDLHRYLAHEPVHARPPSALYTLQKLVRRHRAAVGTAAALAATLVLGTTLSTCQAIRASRAEREQSRLRDLAQQAQAAETALRQRAEAQELATRRRAYAADMNLVQQALATENLGRAQELLDRHRPKPGETDLRGWEWRYLWQSCRSDAEEVLIEPEENWVFSLSVSADGEWMAAGKWYKGELRLLNLRTRESLRLTAGTGTVGVAFSPQAPLLAIGANGTAQSPALAPLGTESPPAHNRVILWNLTTRRPLRSIPISGTCSGLVFSADGQTLVVADDSTSNRQISAWRVADGAKVGQYDALGVARMSSRLAIDRFASVVATPQHDRLVVADLKTGRPIWSALTPERRTAVAFSPDGRLLASGSGAGSVPHIRLWETATHRELPPLTGHHQWIPALLFLPDGKHLISSSCDHTLRLWDVTTGKSLRTLRGHKSEILCAALLPDGETLLSGCKDGSVYRWNLATSPRPPAAGIISTRPIRAWALAHGGKSVVIVQDFAEKTRLFRRHGAAFEQEERIMEFDRLTWVILDGWRPLLAGGTGADNVQVWDWANRARLGDFLLRRDGRAWSWDMGQFSADGQRVAAMFFDQKGNTSHFREWNIGSGHEPRTLEFPATDSEDRVEFSPSLDCQIRALSPEGTIRRLDLRTGQTTTLEAKVDVPSRGMGFSADGRWFAVPSNRSYARVFDAATGRETATVGGYMVGVHSVGFSADGSRLAVGSTSLEGVTLFDLASCERLLTLDTDAGVLRLTKFSDNESLLASQEFSATRLFWWRAPSWAEIAAAENATVKKPSR
jgi:serine/threonine protein kinase/WD40 repeat protein